MAISLTGRFAELVVRRFVEHLRDGVTPRVASVRTLMDVDDAAIKGRYSRDRRNRIGKDAASVLVIAESVVSA